MPIVSLVPSGDHGSLSVDEICHSSQLDREAVGEHWETTDGLCLGGLILKNIPVLNELPVVNAHYIG